VLGWLSAALLAYAQVGYLGLLAAWARVERPPALDEPPAGPLPTVSLVIAAHDEEQVIAAKVANALALDYPADRLEILVGCDGCTDRTAAVAREAGGARVRVLELQPRAGKASVLARLVPAASGDIVVLTDANVMLEPGAVRALARRFQDPAVGAVVGRLRLRNPTSLEFEEGLYWKYETLLKYLEGKRGCVLGANGGLYAIRRILFGPLPADTITDDYVIPVRIAVRGWRVPFEPAAVAHEDTTEDARKEFGRRARIGAGNWQAVARVPDVLDPRTGFVFFAFVSHKLLRWTTPLLLAFALLGTAAAAAAPGAWGYRLLLALQLGFYALAFAGWCGVAGPLRRVASLARYFVAMNVALTVGLWRFARGTQRAAWQRTERSARAA
jgi:cellulose synthase/poly-beta-1,6-N-acetylglucosamine synthase-like glycosyltransferase